MDYQKNELLLSTNNTHDSAIHKLDEFLNNNLDKYDYLTLTNLLSSKYWYTGTLYHTVDNSEKLVTINIHKDVEFIYTWVLTCDDELLFNKITVSELKYKKIPNKKASDIINLSLEMLGIDEYSKSIALLLMDSNRGVRVSTPYCKFHLIQLT